MNKIQKIILPFFPDNSKLQKHWWHRFTKVMSLAFTCICYIFIVINIFNFSYDNFKAYTIAPNHVYTIRDNTTGQKISLGSDELGKEAKKIDSLKFLNDNDAGNIIFNSKEIKNNNSEEIIETVIQSRIKSGTVSFIPFSKGQIRSELVTETIQLVILIILVFLPAIIYRIVLYIVTNNSWRTLNKG